VEHGVFGVLAVFHQGYAQVQRHVCHRGDLVAGRAVGHQLALGIPHQFLHGQPARPLYIPAFDLADVDGRVQRGTDIMEDIGTQHFVFAGQGVDDHLGAGGAKGKVIKRPTTCLSAVIKNLRGFVVPGAR